MPVYRRRQHWVYHQIVQTFDARHRNIIFLCPINLYDISVVNWIRMCNQRRMPWRFILVGLDRCIFSKCSWFCLVIRRGFYCKIRCSIFVTILLEGGCRWNIFSSWIFRVSILCMFEISRRLLRVRLSGIWIAMHSFIYLRSYPIFRRTFWFFIHRIFGKHIAWF